MSDHDEGVARQARAAGVAASVFGKDVMAGREERIGSLLNGPRRTLVLVDGLQAATLAAAVATPAPASPIETADEQRLARAAARVVDHMAPRRDARRVTDPRQLHEAADLAAQGIPLPGTLAHAKLAIAVDAGDFTLAAQIRARVQQMAPMLRDAAVAAEAAAANQTDEVVREARGTLSVIDAAKQKRARRAARRLRERDR